MSLTLGAAIYIALKPIFKIYTIIFVGYLLAKSNIVSMENAKGISNMVVNAILPCLTFNKIVANISWRDIKEIGVIILSAFILFFLGATGAIFTIFTTTVPKKFFWGLIFAGFFPNISDLPIAYIQSMGNGSIFTATEADKGVAYSCIFLFIQSFLMMNFGMWRVVGLDFRDIGEQDAESGAPTTIATNEEYELTAPQGSSNVIRPSNTYQSEDKRYNSDLSCNSITTNDTTSQACCEIPTGYTGPYKGSSVRELSDGPFKFKNDLSCTEIYRVSSTYSSPGALEISRIEDNFLSHGLASMRKRSGISTRREKSTVNELISNYSAADKIRHGDLDLSRPLSLTEEVGSKNASVGNASADSTNDAFTNLGKCNSNSSNHKGNISTFLERNNLKWLQYFVINCLRPASLGAILGIICALIPWVKACFVSTYVHVHKAPDGEPVLNFLMDFTEYIGNACVPLGLLLLGGTLARLEIKTLPPGFIKSAVLMTCFRLIVIPIIGVLWVNKLYSINWLDSRIGKFDMILTWSMPSATAQVYFTAFYTPACGDHVQMNCLSVLFVIQYTILFITVAFVITYTLKVDLKV
ncbi:YLR152C [Saccharomyces arboricola H-6]|uniref:YLR152C n=1 Tax=Saccharomyces arboricola (strain H-6 / AS 2.3317 / CBS 10644) TaxID=1160507 RepID=J8PZC4_SACAR|nr:YLR152C [Saccharomyces arboricola H-6]